MQSVYKLPSAPGNMGRLQWRAVGLGLLVLFMANVAATQSVAHGFDYQSALGMPLTTQAGVGLYPPYMWIIWFLRFGQDGAPEVRHVVGRGLAIAASGSALSVLAGALMMFLSTRRSQNDGVHLHGSAHWARRVDIEAMGLIAKRPVWWKRTEVAPAAGVYVGAWQEKQTAPILYLRHNGPENILAFAPTRSGGRTGVADPAELAPFGGGLRHQGRELRIDGGLARWRWR